jgi:hypothetical protein
MIHHSPILIILRLVTIDAVLVPLQNRKSGNSKVGLEKQTNLFGKGKVNF